MMKKLPILLIVSFAMINPAYSFSPKIESFVIRNYSSKSVVVNREFWEGISSAEQNYMWEQKVGSINLMIKDFISIVNRNVVRPNSSLVIIEYFPSVPIKESAAMYSRMNDMPLMDKIKAIFKSLTISTDDGKKIVTLDILGDQIIKKMVLSGETAYILEIFDYDLVGRPASEW